MIKTRDLLVPLRAALTRSHPAAGDCAVTVKTEFKLPRGTVKLAGTPSAGFTLPIWTVTSPAAFESVTEQLLLAPTGSFVGAQLSDDKVGVDHSVSDAF